MNEQFGDGFRDAAQSLDEGEELLASGQLHDHPHLVLLLQLVHVVAFHYVLMRQSLAQA